ncbi:OmpA family protein [Vibrio aphrogenes]|uniref:OmpA family protein n=1 Tax=Vibrio aphrogenes TaxID=1891186 RepID=UPI000B35A150|nr:OmpA family protein [Vibrio aphrogenes]
MKRIIFSLLVLSLTACSSLETEQPPTAFHSRDLSDSDADGVINARDLCADTPKHAVIDNNGCPIVKYSEEENKLHILFANDSDVIPTAYNAHIKKMSAFLAKYPQTHIVLNGYASPVGPTEHNRDLSNRRAANVYEALVSAGVSPERIKTIGYGDSDPVQAQTTAETMTLSRRVTASVVGMESNVVESWSIYDQRKD